MTQGLDQKVETPLSLNLDMRAMELISDKGQEYYLYLHRKSEEIAKTRGSLAVEIQDVQEALKLPYQATQ